MPSRFAEYVRSDSTELELRDLLGQPTAKLLGVTQAAAAALDALGVSTIFDLGAASIFATARAATTASGLNELTGRFGLAPNDWLKPGVAYASLDEIGGLPVEALRALGNTEAAALKQALDVTTIAELAHWPPQRIAREILGETVGSAPSVDDVQTEALRPRFGEYPTERVYYTSLVMLETGGDTSNLVDLTGALSLHDAIGAATGFNKPAVGALVTFSQSWYAQGITFGQMLHSLALAPGEATRIAVIDFNRRVSAQSSESISESESLASQTAHQRAISEVQNGVATDMQSGGATSHVDSSSDSGGIGLGLSAIVPIGGALLGGGLGGSYQGASTTTDANSTSWSLGKRSVTSSMAQNVNDRTEQHSSSVRNRRATAVREVSQSEHQEVSTRIVANYNHMHALTIQYYEVVQIYRVQAEVQSSERVLFLPIALADFNDNETIEAYRGVLARAALTARARELLLDTTTMVEIRPAKTFHSALLDAALQPLLLSSLVRFAAPAPSVEPDAATNATPTAAGTHAVMARIATPEITPISATAFLNTDDAVIRGSAIVMRPVIRPSSSSLFYPDEVELVALQLEGVAASGITISTAAGSTPGLTLPTTESVIELATPVAISDITDVSIRKQAGGIARGLLRLHLSFRGRRFTSPAIPISMPESPAGTSYSVIRFTSDTSDRLTELKAHLNANRAHYSAQIFRSLGSAAVVGLLAKYRWQGRPLVEQVEPKVLSVAGNFIVLRAPIEQDEASGVTGASGSTQTWAQVLKDRHLTPHSVKDQRLVPIPTDGVFAEAVLGRSNSAEKLDITRFWNWQDSPAPLTPPELAPVSSDSRARDESITPGQLGPATLNIVNPTNLPDPAGLGASLNALAAMNFRDMSGLAGTQSLAETATAGTLTATTEAGKNATALAGVAADVVKTAITAGYGRKKEGGVSGEGARINQGRDMDQRSGGSAASGSSNADGAATSADPTTRTDATPSAGSGRGGGGSSSSGSGGSSGGYEASAFNDAVGNPLGSIPDALASILGGKTTPAPSAKMSRADALKKADAMIDRFKVQNLPLKWHASLDRVTVANRLHDLIHAAHLINQGANGLCGEAAFFYVWLAEDPYEAARFAVQLFNAGAAAVGTEEWVRPRESLRNQDFTRVVQAFVAAHTGIQEADAKTWGADWMMMSSLRDANNWIISYDGTPTAGWGAGSTNGEMERWFSATNLYKSVDIVNDRTFSGATALDPTKDLIVMACDSSMLGNPPEPTPDDNHWCVLKSPIKVDGNGNVSFNLWTWGAPVQEVNALRAQYPNSAKLKQAEFTQTYFGYLRGTR